MIQQLHQSRKGLHSYEQTEPVLMCAADDHYVLPLAVTLHSAAQAVGEHGPLKVVLLDGGISEANWIGLKETLANLPIEVFTLQPDLCRVRDLAVSHHITHTAYLRLLAGTLLPSTVDRVIYLDADLLVCDDVTKLWAMPLGDHYALAAPDIACPYVDARYADCNFRHASPYLSSLNPIRNWHELGLRPDRHYFNSGVMVLNIERMRSDNLEIDLLNCLRDNARHVWCWDQYALNVVFADRWGGLPLRWNQGTHLHEIPSENHSPVNAAEFVDARDNPAIIHFTTEWKPWHYGNRHPLREHFFRQLDQTAWRGWRPSRPSFDLKKNWQAFAAETVKRSIVGYRKVSARLSASAGSTHPKHLPIMREPPTIVSCPQSTPRTDGESFVPELTIFTVPRAFTGSAAIRQRNAIASWRRLAPRVEILLIGDEPGTAEVAREMQVQHVPDVHTNAIGTPLLSSVFDAAQAHARSPVLSFCNCDVILFSDFLDAIGRLRRGPAWERFLAIGRRTDLQVDQRIDFESDQEVRKFRRQAFREGRPASIVCKDFFVFPHGLFAHVPDFSVGRGNWDNWMVRHAKRQRIPVISMSDCVLAVHQLHGYEHLNGGRSSAYFKGAEARENQKLAGGRHLVSGSTCDLRLDAAGRLSPSRMVYVHGEFWQDFPRFAQLLLDFVGSD